jgi:hypothetical protein
MPLTLAPRAHMSRVTFPQIPQNAHDDAPHTGKLSPGHDRYAMRPVVRVAPGGASRLTASGPRSQTSTDTAAGSTSA